MSGYVELRIIEAFLDENLFGSEHFSERFDDDWGREAEEKPKGDWDRKGGESFAGNSE